MVVQWEVVVIPSVCLNTFSFAPTFVPCGCSCMPLMTCAHVTICFHVSAGSLHGLLALLVLRAHALCLNHVNAAHKYCAYYSLLHIIYKVPLARACACESIAYPHRHSDSTYAHFITNTLCCNNEYSSCFRRR